MAEREPDATYIPLQNVIVINTSCFLHTTEKDMEWEGIHGASHYFLSYIQGLL